MSNNITDTFNLESPDSLEKSVKELGEYEGIDVSSNFDDLEKKLQKTSRDNNNYLDFKVFSMTKHMVSEAITNFNELYKESGEVLLQLLKSGFDANQAVNTVSVAGTIFGGTPISSSTSIGGSNSSTNKSKKTTEKERKKAEEEANQKAEEEAKKKAQEEAEAKQRAEEEARQKAEEEAKKQAEEQEKQSETTTNNNTDNNNTTNDSANTNTNSDTTTNNTNSDNKTDENVSKPGSPITSSGTSSSGSDNYHTGGGYSSSGEYTSATDTTVGEEAVADTNVSDSTIEVLDESPTSVEDVIKDNYTKIPSSSEPITSSSSKGKGTIIPVIAGLSAAAAAGIGAKAYLDRKENKQNEETDDIETENWSGEDTLDLEYDDDKVPVAYLDDDDDDENEESSENTELQPEKYDARSKEELADLQ